MSRKKTREEFISEAKRVHGDTYEYSKVEYINANTKVCIVCKEHGEFWQRPNDHIRGIGCNKCSYVKNGKACRMSFAEFLTKAKRTHGDKYQYDEKSFQGSHFKVKITCPVHGIFEQNAGNHIEGQGCPKCYLLNKHKNVHGKGINDLEMNTKKYISYRIWSNMLGRTLSDKNKRKMPTYEDVCICDEWLIYSNFKEWFDDPNNGYIDGYELDKDILVKGNKLYSPNTCCFVPHEINTLIINRKRFRGLYPIGVSKSGKRTYKAIVNIRNTRIHIGTYGSVEEAFNAYKRAKEALLKRVAEEYFEEGLIKDNVYKALLTYKIDIDD